MSLVISSETMKTKKNKHDLLFVFFSSELAKAAAETNGAMVSECVRNTCRSGRNQEHHKTGRSCVD